MRGPFGGPDAAGHLQVDGLTAAGTSIARLTADVSGNAGRLRLNGEVISRPPAAALYWTPAQQLAHLTGNGASLRTGDLYASGTVSGDAPDQFGSLLELTRGGQDPLRLSDGTTRAYLSDGDTVDITATAPGPGSTRISLGTVTGTVTPAG